MVARGELSPAVKMPGIRGAFMFRAADVEQAADRRARNNSEQTDAGAVNPPAPA